MANEGSLHEACHKSMEEGGTPEGDESFYDRYTKPILWASPEPRAVVSYEPCSDVVDRNSRRILYHYTTVVLSSSLCAGPKRNFFPACLQDETLFHSVIFSSAIHASWCHGVPAPPEVYFHRAQAIRLLNEKLSSDLTEPDVFDTVINTIFFLLITESFEGMPEVLRFHWNGLVLAVRMAGGLKHLGLSGITRRCALWADLVTAMILREKPRLQPPFPNITLFDYFGLQSPGTSCLATSFGARIYVFTGSEKLSHVASTAFWGLRSVSELGSIRKMEASVDTASPDDIQYSDRTEALERVLVPLWSVRNKECRHAGLLRMFAWASLMYVYSELRDAPKGMSLYGSLAERIREEMHEARKLELFYDKFPYLMLWILFIAGRSASSDSKLYFAREAAKILAAQDVFQEKDVELASRTFLWPNDREIPVDGNMIRQLPLLLAADTKSSETSGQPRMLCGHLNTAVMSIDFRRPQGIGPAMSITKRFYISPAAEKYPQ